MDSNLGLEDTDKTGVGWGGVGWGGGRGGGGGDFEISRECRERERE